MLIIVDMILFWKILWFQRVSEDVLELGHYEIKETKVCITHYDCLEKKNIMYILSFSILMKVYLYCFFPPIDWFTYSLDAEFIDVISCFVLRYKDIGGREGVAFVIQCEDMYIQKESTYPPTVWPVVNQYTVFLCLFVEHFSNVGVTVSEGRIIGRSWRREENREILMFHS